jgi:hypothetical protein
MVWLPTLKDEVLKVALPLLRGAVPRTVDPSSKVTVPVGVPGADEVFVTVALKVTAWPKTEEAGAADTAVLLDRALTASVVLAELPAKVLSPL